MYVWLIITPSPIHRGTYCFRSISLLICIFVSFFVSLLARLRENGWTDLHEIFRKGVEWPWDDGIQFFGQFGKTARCAKRGRGLLCFRTTVHSLFTLLPIASEEFVWQHRGNCRCFRLVCLAGIRPLYITFVLLSCTLRRAKHSPGLIGFVYTLHSNQYTYALCLQSYSEWTAANCRLLAFNDQLCIAVLWHTPLQWPFRDYWLPH